MHFFFFVLFYPSSLHISNLGLLFWMRLGGLLFHLWKWSVDGVGILFKDKWLTVTLFLLLHYIKPRAAVSVFTIKPLQRHQRMLLCGMYPVNHWCHNWTRTLVLKVGSSGNENRCGGLLTAARVFVPGARACFRAACWDMNCPLTSVGNESQSLGYTQNNLVPYAEVDVNVSML